MMFFQWITHCQAGKSTSRLSVFTQLYHHVLHFAHMIYVAFLCVCVLSHSVMSDSLRSHGLQSTGLLCPWNFPGKSTGVSFHFLLLGIFPTQGSNLHLLHLLHWQADSLTVPPYPTVNTDILLLLIWKLRPEDFKIFVQGHVFSKQKQHSKYSSLSILFRVSVLNDYIIQM